MADSVAKVEDVEGKKDQKWRSVLYCIPDIVLVVIAVVFILLASRGVLPTAPTSVKCNDPSISQTMTSNTISNPVLICMSTIIPLIFFCVTEWLVPPAVCGDTQQSVLRGCRLFLHALQGQVVALVIVEILKLSVAEPRPHFMQTCAPNLTEAMCLQGYIPITWENCTAEGTVDDLNDSMNSFPSGHATLGAFIATYVIDYVLHRLQFPWSSWLSIAISFLWFTWGALCGITRIWDHRHHWWDIGAGAAIGIVGAKLTVQHFSRNFAFLEYRKAFSAVEPSRTKDRNS